ncbi:hypothetical protein SCHPADRAFT_466566 [Schizopora paradoxa]|uniref:Uncharacterized protein n=1 Tax=Schizopora paradoxa TaxID=27342 RepID=A0A0H2RI55_9AGAM|nr:hypothetical protein SCHPADRAFT_466566 [Schizopora paradoxa]
MLPSLVRFPSLPFILPLYRVISLFILYLSALRSLFSRPCIKILNSSSPISYIGDPVCCGLDIACYSILLDPFSLL